MGDIVGEPFVPKVVHDVVIPGAIRQFETKPYCSSGFLHGGYRAQPVGVAFQDLVVRFGDMHVFPKVPEKAAAHNVRMQRAYKDGAAIDG